MSEFDIIERFFAPLTMGQAGSVGLKDDGAVVSIPDGHELVVTSDTLNEAVHFLRGEDPMNIAHKALRVNLSDLASMGADPICYQLNLAFAAQPSESWLERFTGALMADQALYGIYCSGGDTTSLKGGYLSVSITAMGCIPKGRAVRRGGAKDGDRIVLTGAVGDAVLGLKVLQGGLDRRKYAGAVSRYLQPLPRIGCVDVLRRYAHAAADISDGLLADLGHIAAASSLGARIDLEAFVYSQDVQRALNGGVISVEDVLSGGDDYELVLAVPEVVCNESIVELGKHDLNPMVIGIFSSDTQGVCVYENGLLRNDIIRKGWMHF